MGNTPGHVRAWPEILPTLAPVASLPVNEPPANMAWSITGRARMTNGQG
jgi:hypothetical protein